MPALPQQQQQAKSAASQTVTSQPPPPRLAKTKIKATSLDYDIFLKSHNPLKASSLSSTTAATCLSALPNVATPPTSPTPSTAAALGHLSKISGNILTKKLQKPSSGNVSHQQKQAQAQQQPQLQLQPHYQLPLSSEWKLHSQASMSHAKLQHAAKTSTLSPTTKYATLTTTSSNQIPRASSSTSLASSTITSGNYQEFKMELINQGKCLCGQYIRARLRRAGYLNRKAQQRLRSILEPSSDLVYEVFPALNTMGEELERMHPRVYTNISRQLSRAPFGELEDSDTAPVLLNLVAKDLFRSSISWGKIISIFAVCGGFAIDCVRQGHYDYLQYLVDGIAEIIEDDLVHWLIDNGGWLGLQQHIMPQNGKITLLGWLTLFVVMSSSFYVVMKFIKHVGCHLYTFLLRKA